MSDPGSGSLVVGSFTTGGTAVGFVCLFVICIACCHADNHTAKAPWFMKLLTVYNIGMFAFSGVQAYYLQSFLSTQEDFSGVDVKVGEGDAVRTWLWVHAAAQVSHLVDVGYMIARGGHERISYAASFHAAIIFGLWGLCLDNRAVVFANGTIVFVAMMMSVQAVAIYAYRIPATWGKCITPGSQISTGFQITILSLLALQCGYALYYAISAGSVPRSVCTGAWLAYSIAMTILVMGLMFKQRSNRCCSSSSLSGGYRADDEEVY